MNIEQFLIWAYKVGWASVHTTIREEVLVTPSGLVIGVHFSNKGIVDRVHPMKNGWTYCAE